MNIKRLIPCFLLIGSLLLGSCENEQITDMEKQGTELPEGKYPLTFTAVQAAPEGTPQTRVSENTDGMSSHWDSGEVIKVQIANGKAGTYTLDESGNATAQTPCYWQNINNATINAWYSNISGQATETNTNKIVSLSNQSKGLAYVLKATANDVSYNSQNIELQFHHQLAKVRVKLKGDKANDVTGVQVNNYTSCTVTNGNVSVKDADYNYISMHKNGDYYEANLVPMQSITKDDFIRLNDNTKAIINNITELKAGNMYTIEIDVQPAGPKPINPGGTITEGDYIMKGSFTQGVTLNGDNIKLTLEDVSFNGENSAIHITGGTPTIIIKGKNNSLTTTNGAPGIWVDGDNTNVKITGDGSSSSCIKIESGAAAIGTKGDFTEPKCGNITIENIKIIADVKQSGAAAIGYGAAYGAGTNQKIGNITITNSEIEAKLTENQWFPYGAVVGGCGGGEGTYTMGDIRITTTNSSMTPQSYFSKCTCGNVLVGFPASTYPLTVNRGKIYWNGVEKTGNITK